MGSCFTVMIPLEVVPEGYAGIENSLEADKTILPKKILLISEDKDMEKLIKENLKN